MQLQFVLLMLIVLLHHMLIKGVLMMILVKINHLVLNSILDHLQNLANGAHGACAQNYVAKELEFELENVLEMVIASAKVQIQTLVTWGHAPYLRLHVDKTSRFFIHMHSICAT